jgi:hypothetical protein
VNRRDFVKTSLIAGLTLALPKIPAALAQAAPNANLSLQNGRVVNAAGVPQVDFGPDLPVTALHRRDGVWYARLEQQGQPPFWLKSYNGRIWGSLAWQPRRNSPSRQ